MVLLIIACDIFNKLYYLRFPESMWETVYWTGQSISFLAYCIGMFALSAYIYKLNRNRVTFAIKLITGNWIFFALQDLWDEYSDTYMIISLPEIWSFILAITFSSFQLYIWRTRN